MTEVVDDRGQPIRCDAPPRRLVSLVPSTTETLFDLGLGDAVVGVTRFCVRPEAARALPKVGGTKDVERDRVAALAPELVLANCEENTLEILDGLSDLAPVYAAFPRDIDGAVADLRRLGRLLGVDADAWADRIEAARQRLAHRAGPRRRVAYLIWRDPWMTAAADTFLHHVLAEAGLDNVFAGAADRFPVVSAEQLADAAPDLVLLSSEPFPFRPRHADELADATGLPRASFRFVDGQAFTWHGTRLARALEALADDRDGQLRADP